MYPLVALSVIFWFICIPDEHSFVSAALFRLSSSTTGSCCRDPALGFTPSSSFPGKQSSLFHVMESTYFILIGKMSGSENVYSQPQ